MINDQKLLVSSKYQAYTVLEQGDLGRLSRFDKIPQLWQN